LRTLSKTVQFQAKDSPQDNSPKGHDTVNVIVLDPYGRMTAGASSNGYIGKIPGRVGDVPLAGAGVWVDQTVGGCGCTGQGDITQRFSPCAIAIENMRRGASPQDSVNDALTRIYLKWPGIAAAIVVMDPNGQIGMASMNQPDFQIVVLGAEQKGSPEIYQPPPFKQFLIDWPTQEDVDVSQRLRAFIPITAICSVLIGLASGWILRGWKVQRDRDVDSEYFQLTDDEAKGAQTYHEKSMLSSWMSEKASKN